MPICGVRACTLAEWVMVAGPTLNDMDVLRGSIAPAPQLVMCTDRLGGAIAQYGRAIRLGWAATVAVADAVASLT